MIQRQEQNTLIYLLVSFERICLWFSCFLSTIERCSPSSLPWSLVVQLILWDKYVNISYANIKYFKKKNPKMFAEELVINIKKKDMPISWRNWHFLMDKLMITFGKRVDWKLTCLRFCFTPHNSSIVLICDART